MFRANPRANNIGKTIERDRRTGEKRYYNPTNRMENKDKMKLKNQKKKTKQNKRA